MFFRILLLILLFTSTRSFAQEPIGALSVEEGLPLEKVALGRLLFFDTRLSKNNTISCASCHDLSLNGTDSLPKAIGINDRLGNIKTPTVYNTAFNIAQFWDGRSRTLEAQVSGPIHNPVEMGSHWIEVVEKLKRDAKINQKFDDIYIEGVRAATIADAIATFERSLVTVNAPFDLWLKGDTDALSQDEKEGYRLFKAYGCISCHQGKNVGGNMYAYMGAMGDYFADRDKPVSKADLGRFNVTGNEDDKYLFKVPSLRLVALQKYFFHDASESSLENAIQVMARYQLGRSISDEDAGKIALFLHSLAGKHQEMTP